MNTSSRFPLAALADAYSTHLFADALRHRLAHHLSHVSSELWLSMELAYVFNRSTVQLGFAGWTAVLESQRVDVTLLPPGGNAVLGSAASPVFIECKFVGPDWWNTIWRDVALDLEGKQRSTPGNPKPRATYAVCFLYDVLQRAAPNRRSDTEERYRRFLASVPSSGGKFSPYGCDRTFSLLHSSPERLIEWPDPIPGRWPHGFSITLRILWIEGEKEAAVAATPE